MALFLICDKCGQIDVHCVCNFERDYPGYKKMTIKELKKELKEEREEFRELEVEIFEKLDELRLFESYVDYREKKEGKKK